MLLAEIFACVLALTGKSPNPFYSIYRTSLCGVCKYWNDIILDHPQFWTQFYFFLPFQQIPLPTLEVWLQRSANMLIEIYISDVSLSLDAEQQEFLRQYRPKMLSVLLQHLPQWKTLDIEATFPLLSMIQNIDFSSSPFLAEIGISFNSCPREIHQNVLLTLENVVNLHSLEYGPNITSPSILLQNPPFGFLKRLKRLDMTEQIPVSEMLEIVRRCPSAEWICTRVMTLNTEPLITTSSENLRILDLSFSWADYGTLTRLHLPNLKVLFVHYIYTAGFDTMREISKFISGDSGRSLQVVRVVNLGIGPADRLFGEQSTRKIPIVEILVKIPADDRDKYDEFEQVVSGYFERWKEMDNRFKKTLRHDGRSWSVGWVESKVFKWDLDPLPASILDTIEIRLLV